MEISTSASISEFLPPSSPLPSSPCLSSSLRPSLPAPRCHWNFSELVPESSILYDVPRPRPRMKRQWNVLRGNDRLISRFIKPFYIIIIIIIVVVVVILLFLLLLLLLLFDVPSSLLNELNQVKCASKCAAFSRLCNPFRMKRAEDIERDANDRRDWHRPTKPRWMSATKWIRSGRGNCRSASKSTLPSTSKIGLPRALNCCARITNKNFK